jgi:hypothetical protein
MIRDTLFISIVYLTSYNRTLHFSSFSAHLLSLLLKEGKKEEEEEEMFSLSINLIIDQI